MLIRDGFRGFIMIRDELNNYVNFRFNIIKKMKLALVYQVNRIMETDLTLYECIQTHR